MAGTLLLTMWIHVFGLIAADFARTQTAVESEIANLARVSQEHAGFFDSKILLQVATTDAQGTLHRACNNPAV